MFRENTANSAKAVVFRGERKDLVFIIFGKGFRKAVIKLSLRDMGVMPVVWRDAVCKPRTIR
jgi:hypothetical protein